MEATSVLGRRWIHQTCDEQLALAISQRHGLSQTVGQLLATRGVALEDVERFLQPRLRDWLPDPSHLLDMDRAAARLARAIADGERVGIIGDYDVDGLTSTALMVRYLRCAGIEPTVMIPDRLGAGYGASAALFDGLAAAGCRLCLTLDNGTTAYEALAHAAGRGQEVLVVDHHAAEPELPPAYAVVNPNRLDQTSPLGHLAAVGVVFALIVAVNRELRRRTAHASLPDPLCWLDLVALGTICDVVALTGLNRAFVAQGLRLFGRTAVPGITALAREAGIKEVRDAWQLGFALGPRLNAASRLGEAVLGARLLTTDSPEEAAGIAARLCELNRQRQAIERELLAAADAAVQDQLAADRRVLVAAGEGWHAGVIGIVASRLVERYGRPAFVIALQDGEGKGSARSIPGCDVGALVIAARRGGLLDRAGGHAMAAGLSVAVDGVQRFADFAHERAAGGAAGPRQRSIAIEGRLSLGGVTATFAEELERVAPYGPGNLEPRFAVEAATIVDAREVGDGHLACWLAGPVSGRLKAVAFRCRTTALGKALGEHGQRWHLVGRVKLDRWNGSARPSFEIEDAAPA